MNRVYGDAVFIPSLQHPPHPPRSFSSSFPWGCFGSFLFSFFFFFPLLQTQVKHLGGSLERMPAGGWEDASFEGTPTPLSPWLQGTALRVTQHHPNTGTWLREAPPSPCPLPGVLSSYPGGQDPTSSLPLIRDARAGTCGQRAGPEPTPRPPSLRHPCPWGPSL